MIATPPYSPFSFVPLTPVFGDGMPLLTIVSAWPLAGATPGVIAAVDPDDEEDVGDEEDLAVSQPPVDEESSFDDFDDEFDDDFEEDASDPDWDHPDDGDAEPPPGKNPGRKK